MTDVKTTRSEIKQGLRLSTGTKHEVRLIGEIECLRLLGLFFDTNKAFILPGTLDLLTLAKTQYERHPKGEVVVFGHTDTTNEPALNDPLSQARADMVAAYLKDDVEAWLAMFTPAVRDSQRWGTHEDFLMLSRMKGFTARPADVTPTTWFQKDRGLKVDGIAGPQTRRQLITEYMAVDGTTLPKAVTLTAIGCGEQFPLDDTANQLDAAPQDGKKDQLDRRVELFFVHSPESAVPPKTREAYPEWLKLSATLNLADGGSSIRVVRLRLVQGGVPLAGMEYLVSSPKAVVASGKLSADGLLEAVIPSGIGEISVEVREANLRRTLKVRSTTFPEATSVEGAQLRLAALGSYYGQIDGKRGDLFTDALTAFREQRGLPADSTEAVILEDLRQAYGS